MTLWVIEWRQVGRKTWHPSIASVADRRWALTGRLKSVAKDTKHEFRIAKYVRAPERK